MPSHRLSTITLCHVFNQLKQRLSDNIKLLFSMQKSRATSLSASHNHFQKYLVQIIPVNGSVFQNTGTDIAKGDQRSIATDADLADDQRTMAWQSIVIVAGRLISFRWTRRFDQLLVILQR